LYIALFLGIVLASTFFAGINVGADTTAKQALDQALDKIPVDFYASGYYLLTSQNIRRIVNNISAVSDVVGTEAISRAYPDVLLPGKDYPDKFTLVGISQGSRVYDGWAGGPSSIEENQTYVFGSSYTGILKQGDIIQVNMTLPIWRPEFQNTTFVSFTLNLTVAGFAQLDDKASAIAQGRYYAYDVSPLLGPSVIVQPSYVEDILIVDWNKTLAGFIDVFQELSQSYIYTDILVYVDRDSLISVWDIAGSLQRLDVIKRKIQQQIDMTGFGLYVTGTLDSVLMFAQISVSLMRLVFVGVSLPVFFVAWYMGTTVSDVSFNLRRREIGLLLTKGFSRGQLFRMFLSEALLIGLAGGVIGIVLSLALNPVFVRAVGGEFAGVPVVGIDTAILTVVFSVGIIILAVFRPARRASNLSTVDALREYIYVEEVKPYKKLWPWVAFILGSYKMVILLLGVNLLNEVSRLAMSGANFLLILLASVWAFFDYIVLTAIGPVLFFWGCTKIFIRGSLKFQELTAKAAKFLGDLGVLATRNVQRNPARAASIAFLIALIIGYGIQVTGTLASDQDYNTRLVYAGVGADVKVELGSPVNVSATWELVNKIRSNVSGVASTTGEYSLYGTSNFGGLQLTVVNTTDWLNTAYYEDGWFSGNDIKTAFQHLESDNHTIILDRDISERNSLRLGEKIRVSFSLERFPGEHLAEDLTIVGFFGVKKPESPYFGPGGIYTSLSYVSQGLFHELGQTIRNSATARILVKLNSGADGVKVATDIKTLVGKTGLVYSVSEQLQQQQSNIMSTGTLNVQRLGVAFAILAASVGTALVTLVSLKERQREASIMSVRGLSFKQLTTMLLTENLAVVTFALLLGAIAGLIIVYGNVVSFSSTAPSMVTKRLVFPPDALLIISASFVLVFASTIIPVIFMTRRFMSRLERVVRQA